MRNGAWTRRHCGKCAALEGEAARLRERIAELEARVDDERIRRVRARIHKRIAEATVTRLSRLCAKRNEQLGSQKFIADFFAALYRRGERELDDTETANRILSDVLNGVTVDMHEARHVARRLYRENRRLRVLLREAAQALRETGWDKLADELKGGG